MINVDSKILDAFVNENAEFLTGCRVQKIRQPTRKEIVLILRKNSESAKLYININPNFAHICLMSKENEEKRRLQQPHHPPMFCMLLRKHMEGARIIRVNKPENERIIEIYFENYNEIGDIIDECLAVELMGKHSNIVLYNTDNNIIIGCAHNIGSEKSKERELSGGLPYIYPPKQNKNNLLLTKYAKFEKIIKQNLDKKSLKNIINENFLALPQIIVEEICKNEGINDTSQLSLQKLYIALHGFLENRAPVYTMSADKLHYSPVIRLDTVYKCVNSLIDDYYANAAEIENFKNLSNELKNRVKKETDRLETALKIRMQQIEKSKKSVDLRRKADIITANIYKLKNFKSPVVLTDYNTGRDIEIEMDDSKTAAENAADYYKLYNKAKKTCEIAEKFIAETKTNLEYYYELLYSIEDAQSYQDLVDIKQEIMPDESFSKKINHNSDVKIYSEEINGYRVYVGKNNKQNDYIYSKLSAPADLWFHVLNAPGSHVLMKTDKKLPDNDTLLKAAMLAKKYSSAKNSSKTSVIYTQRKYIKRPLKTKSGFVVYKNEQEIVVE